MCAANPKRKAKHNLFWATAPPSSTAIERGSDSDSRDIDDARHPSLMYLCNSRRQFTVQCARTSHSASRLCAPNGGRADGEMDDDLSQWWRPTVVTFLFVFASFAFISRLKCAARTEWKKSEDDKKCSDITSDANADQIHFVRNISCCWLTAHKIPFFFMQRLYTRWCLFNGLNIDK